MKRSSLVLSLSVLVGMSTMLSAQVKDAPANIAAAMLVKLVAFEKKVSSGGDISIYVLGAAEVAAELQKGIGKPIGNATLKSVESGDDLPGNKPSVLYVGNAAKLPAVTKYTHENKILSATGLPDLVSKGVTLGFGVGEDGKPKILLNLTTSVEEGLEWNPAIMKVATTIK